MTKNRIDNHAELLINLTRARLASTDQLAAVLDTASTTSPHVQPSHRIAATVARGSFLLDRVQPGWYKRIPIPVDMLTRNVLDYIYGSYSDGLEQLGLDELEWGTFEDGAPSYGFSVPGQVEFEMVAPYWVYLERMWMQEIDSRWKKGVKK